MSITEQLARIEAAASPNAPINVRIAKQHLALVPVFAELAQCICDRWGQGKDAWVHVYTKEPRAFYEIFSQIALGEGFDNDRGNAKQHYFNASDSVCVAATYAKKITVGEKIYGSNYAQRCWLIKPSKKKTPEQWAAALDYDVQKLDIF